MRKELLVAIVLGFGIGLVIVFGIVTAKTAVREHSQAAIGTGITPAARVPSGTPTPAAAVNAVTITDPQDGVVVNSDKLTLRGTTSPQSSVVISTEKNDVITTSDDSGSFTFEVDLVSGANEIRVVSFSPSQERSEAQVTVVYSTADF